MGTWNAFYVRAQAHKAVPLIRQDFRNAEVEEFEEFTGVKLGDDEFEAPEKTLAKMSSALGTDVYWMGFQSTVDAFQFHHWNAGKHVRALVYGCFRDERTWERAEGQPEPWEQKVFFDPKNLESELKYAEEEERRVELQRIWRGASIIPGNTEPGLSASEVAHKIAQFYRFPHYGIE